MSVGDKSPRIGQMIPCACGCNRRFRCQTPHDKYFSEGCRIKAHNERQNKRAAAKRAKAAKAGGQ